MSIKDSKTRVTFVTEKKTVKQLRAIVKARKLDGRKATVSSLLDELVKSHLETCELFKATPAATPTE